MQKFTLETYDQEEIQEGIIKNDQSVLKWLYESQFHKLEKYILNNSGSSEQAKDTYQEAYITVWNKVRKGAFHPTNGTGLTGYLYQVGKNKWIDQLRSVRVKKTTDLSPQHDRAVEDEEDVLDDYRVQVEAEFKLLGDKCREIISRFYFKRQSMEEIAKVFQWTEATTRNNKYRCLQRLREKVKTKIND
ncbi:MAG: sigma-70 family RNA polymerase sigma factor [Cyclobacteriaceae bacterium]